MTIFNPSPNITPTLSSVLTAGNDAGAQDIVNLGAVCASSFTGSGYGLSSLNVASCSVNYASSSGYSTNAGTAYSSSYSNYANNAGYAGSAGSTGYASSSGYSN